MDDLTALRRYARAKDPEAFTHLVSVYQQMVYGVCLRRLANHADAEDATQETFLKLAKNAGRIRRNVGAWLHACANSTATDTVRKEARRRRHHAAAAQLPPPRADTPEHSELIANLDEAMGLLSEEDRELICRRFFAGRTQAELAEGYGVSQSMISRRLRQAVAHLHTRMKRLGCVAAPAAMLPTLESHAANVVVPASVHTALVKIGLAGAGTTLAPSFGALLMALSTKTKIAAAAVVVVTLTGGSIGVVKLRGTDDPVTQSSRALAQQNYGLSADETVRLLPAPFPPERNELLSNFAHSRDLNDWFAVFEWHAEARSGEQLRFKAASLTPRDSASGHNGYRNWIAENVLDMPWYSLGDHRGLRIPHGDWVIRGDLTPEQRRAGYAEALSVASGRQVTLIKSKVRRDCVVWRGRPVPPPPSNADAGSIIVLTAGNPPGGPDAHTQANGWTTSLGSWLANVELPLILQIDGPEPALVSYALMPDLSQIKPSDPQRRVKVSRVLRHVEQQMPGGTFSIEPRELEVWTPVAQ